MITLSNQGKGFLVFCLKKKSKLDGLKAAILDILLCQKLFYVVNQLKKLIFIFCFCCLSLTKN